LTKKDIIINEIVIRPIPQTPKGTLAFVDFCLLGAFKIKDAMIVSSQTRGLRIVYPIKYDRRGLSIQTFAPIKRDIAEELEKLLLDEYRKRIK
jgi:hypothetical protein